MISRKSASFLFALTREVSVSPFSPVGFSAAGGKFSLLDGRMVRTRRGSSDFFSEDDDSAA
jgi:hypothetical protein